MVHNERLTPEPRDFEQRPLQRPVDTGGSTITYLVVGLVVLAALALAWVYWWAPADTGTITNPSTTTTIESTPPAPPPALELTPPAGTETPTPLEPATPPAVPAPVQPETLPTPAPAPAPVQ